MYVAIRRAYRQTGVVWETLLPSIILMVANFFDTVLTLIFVTHSNVGMEMNPLSSGLLARNPAVFVAFKLIAMPILVIMLDWKARQNRNLVKTMWFLCGIYTYVAVSYTVVFFKFIYLEL